MKYSNIFRKIKKKEINYTNRYKKPFGNLSGLTSLFYNLAIANTALSITMKNLDLIKGKENKDE